MLRELLRSLTRALPIVAGVAGPIVIASFALLAWAGVAPMKAVTLPWRSGASLWLVQAMLAAWPLWALRRRLLPEAWCVQLRCLPFTTRALWGSDVAVSAVVLAPLAGLYALSVAVFALHRPPWWLQAMPWALASLAGSWIASCLIGAGALAWQRRSVGVRAQRTMRAQSPEVLLAARPGAFAALLWWPAWRDALTPGARGLIAGVVAAIALAAAWTQGWWPIVPGAAWALMFSMLAIALTERLQRTMESHLAALAPWLASLPASGGWRWRARVAICAPMLVAGAAAVLLVVASRPWRAGPLMAFALGLVAAPAAMTSVPSAHREAHVALWAVCTGLLTAFGSELWN
ncbi:hypothetical protein [Scleromatobacter humisilvae]|uniref:Uncharacterized protein n=1 Tax=Scleromatobacter humisilvae TaxID=2897159 RepID=A0A9X1YG36_9BURK|nr:hypothetical protein [Scleromatobacter humisilvae]MCK9685418.1 hypothetical protein [Scleromatobacter humisilvae]